MCDLVARRESLPRDTSSSSALPFMAHLCMLLCRERAQQVMSPHPPVPASHVPGADQEPHGARARHEQARQHHQAGRGQEHRHAEEQLLQLSGWRRPCIPRCMQWQPCAPPPADL